MLTAADSHPAELNEWIRSLPAGGHGLYTRAEWQEWAHEQQLTGGGRLWHYWSTSGVHRQEPALDTTKVTAAASCSAETPPLPGSTAQFERRCNRIWLRSEWMEWVHGLPAEGSRLFTKREWLEWTKSEDALRREAREMDRRRGPRGLQERAEGPPHNGTPGHEGGGGTPHSRAACGDERQHGRRGPDSQWEAWVRQLPAAGCGRYTKMEWQDWIRAEDAARKEARGWMGCRPNEQSYLDAARPRDRVPWRTRHPYGTIETSLDHRVRRLRRPGPSRSLPAV